MKQFIQSLVGRVMIACSVCMLIALFTPALLADDISDTTTTVAGYVTAATVVGIAVLLFTLGRKVLRRLIVAVGFLSFALLGANAATDIAGVTTSVSGYVTAATVVGIAVLLFALGRKVLRRLI